MSPSTPTSTRISRSRKQHDDAARKLPPQVQSLLVAVATALTEQHGRAGPVSDLIRQATKTGLGSPHLSVAEAATYIGITPDTLKRKIQKGEVPCHRRPGMRPYFLRNEIDEWLAAPSTLCAPVAPFAENQEVKPDHEETGSIDEEEIRELLEGANPPGSR